MSSEAVRVRFAPSPTGHLHVGGARTAIYNWLFARHHGGKFILRIEDTDEARSTRESEEMVLSDLRWLGLDWDEGPDNGGPHAPYRQSERREIYLKAAAGLLESGHAYRCFCPEELLEEKRRAAEAEGRPPHYDLTCYRLSPDEALQRVARGEKFVTRFHVPKEEGAAFNADVEIDDLIRGPVVWKKESLGDFILLRSDGMPIYNFCVVVDDHDMEITHVVRAVEHLTNTQRQVLIYRALGWPEPKFAHVSLILGPDRAKLSKRHGATSVGAFEEEGYLPDAMLNYLTLLGWSSPDGAEIFSREQVTRDFTLERVHASDAVFDAQKLSWVNAQYLHAMPTDKLLELAKPHLEKAGFVLTWNAAVEEWAIDAIELVKKSLHKVSDVVEQLRFLFEDQTEALMTDAETRELLQEEGSGQLLTKLSDDLATNGVPTSAEAYNAMAERLKSASGLKGKKLFLPIRAALTGAAHGPELVRSVPLLERAAHLDGIKSVASPKHRVETLRTLLAGSWI